MGCGFPTTNRRRCYSHSAEARHNVEGHLELPAAGKTAATPVPGATKRVTIVRGFVAMGMGSGWGRGLFPGKKIRKSSVASVRRII